MHKFDYDVAVLGGGSAGYAAARTAAGAGLKTAVIEGGEEVGGLCILRGCMPTKALLYTADFFPALNDSRFQTCARRCPRRCVTGAATAENGYVVIKLLHDLKMG